MEEFKDVIGNIIQVGDIVYRPKLGKLVIHRVLRINKSALVLSILRKQFSDSNYYTWIKDTTTIESLGEHNSSIYFRKCSSKNLIKYINK